MARESKNRYAINFDLTIADLRKHYNKRNPKGAYGVLKRYMLSHGFSHRQWSGYISEKTMTRTDLVDFTTALHKQFPWLINCEGRMDATVVSDIFDIKQMILDIEFEDEDMEL